MGDQAGGNVRFRGPGSLWKSSWKGRRPFSQMCCVSGFGPTITDQYYVNDNGPLPIVPANGFFLGALVGVSQIPTGTEVIARNGNVANEGWRLSMFSQLTIDGGPGVGFNFTFFDGAGVALALVSANGAPLWTEDEQQFFGPERILFAFVGYEPPSGSFPNGEAAMLTLFSSASGALAAPYVNSDPRLSVGRDGLDVLEAPNCLVGLVGGEALFNEGAIVAETISLAIQWLLAMEAAGEFLEVPNNIGLTGFANLNGWRIVGNAGPGSSAPNPLPDFVDSEPLVYANAQPPAGDLTIDCISPVILT